MSTDDEAGPSNVVKRPRHLLGSREKENIVRVFDEQYKELKHKSVAVKKVSELFQVSDRTVYRVLQEKNSTGKVVSPKKATGRPSTLSHFDETDLFGIRKKVHEFFFANEIPTLDKLIKVINEDEDLPELSRTCLWRILKTLNMKYVKRSRNSLLIDKEEIIVWRRRYLRDIKQYRQEGRTIYYLDETWVNEGHTTSKVWTDKSVTSSRQAFIEGLSPGLRSPTGKGKRLIIVHIGSSEGFLEDGLLCMESTKTGDYHEEMNAATFEKWFVKILEKINKNSVLVMDNAPYHSRKFEKIPTINSSKEAIKTWLGSKNISYEQNMVKSELINILRRHKSKYDLYAVDEMAKAADHVVLRLPPYHCELNPIELVWAQVKGYVAANNKTFKLSEVKDLVNAAIAEINPEKWQACIKHVEEIIEKKMWDVDTFIEHAAERLVIDLGEDSSSDSDF